MELLGMTKRTQRNQQFQFSGDSLSHLSHVVQEKSRTGRREQKRNHGTKKPAMDLTCLFEHPAIRAGIVWAGAYSQSACALADTGVLPKAV